MQIERTGETYYREFPLDWIIGAVFLFLGSLLLYFVYDPVLWGTWVSTEGPQVPVGFLERVEGGVRFKRSGASVWFDLAQSTAASDGDAIYTSEKGRAQVFLESGEKIILGPDSLVVLKTEKPKKPQPSWVGLRPQGVIEVQKGRIEVETSSGSRGVLIETPKGRLALTSNSKYRERVTLEKGPSGKLSLSAERPEQFQFPLKVARRSEDDKRLRRSPASAFPDKPDILAPPNREHFQADQDGSVSIGLRWKRVTSLFDVEVEVYMEGESAPVYQGMGSSIGTSLVLSKGDYYWVARARDNEGRASIWTPRHFFSVDEKIEDQRLVQERKPASLHSEEEIVAPVQEKSITYRAPRPPENLEKWVEPVHEVKKVPITTKEVALSKPKVIHNNHANKIQKPKLAREPAVAPPLPEIKVNSAQISKESENDLRIGLSWKPIVGAIKTEVMVFDGGMLFQRSIAMNEAFVLQIQALNTAGLFYQILAHLEDGRSVSSELTPIEVSAFLPVPNLPDDGAKVQLGEEVLMTWSRSVGAQGYEVEVALDPEFKKRVHARPTIENFEALETHEIGDHFWRVRAVNETGDSGWSLPKRFEVVVDGTELR